MYFCLNASSGMEDASLLCRHRMIICELEPLDFKFESQARPPTPPKFQITLTGVNNAFLIATRSELAQTYNDSSVLESHHLAMLYRMLSEPGLDLFHRLDPAKWREVRKHIINAVIHTDMTFHFPLVSKVGRPHVNPNWNSCIHKTAYTFYNVLSAWTS